MKKLMTALLSLTALAWASRKLMKRFPPEQAAADQGATGHVLAIADANADGGLTLDAAGRIEAANGVVRTLLGFDEHELRGRDLRVLLPQLAWSAANPEGVPSAELGGFWQARCRQGDMIEVEVTLAALPGTRSNGGPRYVCVLRDAGERRAQDEHFRHQAHFDMLTQLPNRMLLADRFKVAAERARRYGLSMALIYVDLDNFKQLNDSLGHAAGDEALETVAARLLDCVRQSDTVARIGGDEFAIFLAEVERADDAEVVAHKVVAALARPMTLGGREAFVTASLGVASYPVDGETLDRLMQHADTAMCQVKAAGGNAARFFSTRMESGILARYSLETELRHALANDELEVYFQPQFSLASGRVAGVEALVRWHHPREGLVGPDRFIPFAEESGLILSIGAWVLETACRAALALRAEVATDFYLSVNLSPRQVRESYLSENLDRVLDDLGFPPQALILELTESVLLGQGEDTLAALAEFRRRGVRLALDDFGKGYSSLSYLKRFPVDVLKLDRSFIDDVVEVPAASALVDAMVMMGHAMGMSIVTEGVESAAQLAHLAAHGVDAVQGHYCAAPSPASERATCRAWFELRLDAVPVEAEVS